ncbi:glycoside hydrolase family 30 protein [Coniochaeta ligniaria NRRL 30616]|uniref:glucan endo-1,6-beta-glucosidase n=1 Tax=Coniochaeta ligniaria NRRL 30616 TaxID=1408157 RepID=A0A1J7JQN4_9PEZI|nr:glycoside hydrolase family 30 protein [Coniochaeta ligniaria NRRL 30616]
MRSPLAALLVSPLALASTIKDRATTPQAFASSSDGSLKLSAYNAPVKGSGSPNGASTWALNIDDTSSGHKQTVDGFGAAVTDATVTVFNQLPAAKLTELLNNLMTPAGANFALMRHTIASSDLSADPSYSYDDAGGQVDSSLSNFNLGDRGTAMAKLLARMKGLQSALTILGSPWSPPGWMKLNGVIQGTTSNNNLNHAYASQFAQYFVKYIQAFTNLGAPIDAITIQNEPLNSQAGMPTMYVYADESGNLIQQNIGPALRSAGLSTGVWAYDHNTDVPSYPQTVLNEASQYVTGVAWHCYASSLNWGVLTDFHNTNPNVKQYMTECWTSSSGTGWSQAADFTMGPLQNWASGAIAWTLGTDNSDGPHLSGSGPCTTCRGLVTVDAASGTYTFQVDYYMLAQFSKFIPKGAVVLSGTGSYSYSDGTGIQSVATINPDNTRTVVIENKFSNDVYVTLTTKSGETWSGLTHANSVVTWVLPAAA